MKRSILSRKIRVFQCSALRRICRGPKPEIASVSRNRELGGLQLVGLEAGGWIVKPCCNRGGRRAL